jgi:hypothetical protein
MRWLGFLAFPLSATISAAINILILFFLLPRKIGRIDFGPLLKYAARLAAGAAASGLAAGVLYGFLHQALGGSLWNKLLNVIFCGFTAVAVFYGSCLLLGVHEARTYVKRFLRG